MNLQESKNRICKLMSRFVTEVNISNKMGMTDINQISEDVLIPLFSEIYGHSDLKNLNISEGSNFPAIDLGDEKRRIAYQITAESNSQKIKDTLEKFVAHELYKRFDHLIVYILTKKQKTYQGRGFKEIIDGKFCFDKENDIRDYQDLVHEIRGFSLKKLRKIETILEQHFGDEESKIWDPLDWLKKANQYMEGSTDQKSTIKINREKLLNDLKNFVSQGNGVIIGSPGIGKTYLLRELCQSLKSTETPRLFLSIDQLGDGTQEDLSNALPDSDDLIEKLKSVPISDECATLLFDAFDAARNERTRKRFLRLIKRAIQELDKWNVVVTVRTYDARKLQELLDLFDSPYDNDLDQYHTEGILCRHFTIPSLNEDEIRQAFDQIPHLESIYESGSQDFKSLLANPFNLWLLEKILTTSQDVPDFSQILSEVQLLGLFWQRRIEGVNNADDREFLLTKVARLMIEERSLTVRQEDVYDNLHLDRLVRKIAWDNLLSDEILAKVSSGQSIAFSHNILFDYAISILLIEDDPRKLEEFVLEDPSRPLFLRPSLTYFFTRLWYDDPETFWKAFWYVLPNDQSVHLRLFARLIPTSVIANEARKIRQLAPLLEKLQNGEDVATEAIMRLLQSFRALQIERDALWISFFYQVSVHWHADFAGDLSTLTSEILERATDPENTAIIDTCGEIGRRLFKWVWQEREANSNDWYNRLGSTLAVPLIAKTYGTNVEESRLLLEKVLELTQEDNFPISFLTWLTEHVDKIWIHDPDFVALVYHAVFIHDEISDERTSLSSGPILPLTSTRQQDYSSCQYRLIKHFSNFLQSAPLVATQAAIQSLNFFIIKKHIARHLKEGVKFEDLIQTFEFRGNRTHFVQDNSYIWDETSYRDKPIQIADELFKFIAALASSQDSLSRLDSLLDIFRDEVWVAFFWRRLLKTADQFPKVFVPRLFDLCIAKPIQLGNEVVHELGLFLENAAFEFTPTQLRQIEDIILALPEEATDKEDRKFLEYRRNRLIASIPKDLLQTNDTKKIREEMERIDQVPENKPLVSFTSWSGPYTEEKRLQEQGVDTTTPENQELQRFFEPLDKFKSDWLNDTPTEEATESILPLLQEAYAAIDGNSEVDKEVMDSLWFKLTACVAILSRVADKLETNQFTFCRQLALKGAKHKLPEPDPKRDAQEFTVYSPYPRHEAAQALLRLSIRQLDAEILDAIESLASDPVPSVRMVTAMELSRVYFKMPEKFWHFVEHRAAHETSQTVQKYIYHTLAHVVARKKENEDKTVRIMEKLLKRIPQPIVGLEPSNPFIDLLMWLAISRENSWALKKIKDTFFKDPIRFANSLNSAVSGVLKDYVIPKNLEMPEGYETTQRAITFLERAIDVASNGVQELSKTFKNTEEEEKKLRDIYTVIDGVITYLSFEIAYEKDRSEEPTEKITDELRCRFYNEIKPLMEQVIAFAEGENGVMFAPTAHDFLELLTSCLSCNPKEVLHLAAGVARSSERFGYNLDSLAVAEVVKFVEIILADHREEVRDGQGLEDLLNLLDIFAKTGWSDALRLVWRLDEVFR